MAFTQGSPEAGEGHGSVGEGCGAYAASIGKIDSSSVRLNGDNQRFRIRVEFEMSQAEIDAAQCAGEYIELSTSLQNFSLPSQFDGYSMSTDLPGGVHDLANSDWTSDSLTPGVTAVKTADLQPGQRYFFQVGFDDDGITGRTTRFGLLWGAAHWANTRPGDNPITAAKEKAACALGHSSGNPTVAAIPGPARPRSPHARAVRLISGSRRRHSDAAVGRTGRKPPPRVRLHHRCSSVRAPRGSTGNSG